MRITTIAVTYGGKLNLGNYESATIEICLEAILEDGEDPAQAEVRLWEEAKRSVRAQARPLVEGRRAQVNAVFMGLPEGVRKDIEE